MSDRSGEAHDPTEFWYTETDLPRSSARYLWWDLSSNTGPIYSTARRSYITSCALCDFERFCQPLIYSVIGLRTLGMAEIGRAHV